MSAAALLIVSALLHAGLGWALRWAAVSPASVASPAERFKALAAARRLARAGLALVALGLFALGAAL